MIISASAYRNLSMVRNAVGDLESAFVRLATYRAIVQNNAVKEQESGYEVEELETLLSAAETYMGKAMNNLDIIINVTAPERTQERAFIFDNEGNIHEA